MLVVLRRFDEHLVMPYGVTGFTTLRLLGGRERGKEIGHTANKPIPVAHAVRVLLFYDPSFAFQVNQHGGGRFSLVPRTERAPPVIPTPGGRFLLEVVWPLLSMGGDDDPAVEEIILSDFVQQAIIPC
jgi:hypothetical protein